MLLRFFKLSRLNYAGMAISLLIAGCSYSALLFSLTLGSLSLMDTTTWPPHKETSFLSVHSAQQASLWLLSKTEWQRYTQLMQGPAGRWYAHLDPPEVLGLLARTDSERQHYATLVVKQRKARIDRELAFNRAVHQAWRQHYADLKPIQSFDARPFRASKP